MISSVSYVCLPQQYTAHLPTAPDGAFIKAYQADVSMDFPPRLYRTASQGEILCKSQLQSPLSLLKNRQPNLAFLSGRLTSSSDLLSRSSSVQRLFFCGDVIVITSWTPDVVNLVRPVGLYTACRLRHRNAIIMYH